VKPPIVWGAARSSLLTFFNSRRFVDVNMTSTRFPTNASSWALFHSHTMRSHIHKVPHSGASMAFVPRFHLFLYRTEVQNPSAITSSWGAWSKSVSATVLVSAIIVSECPLCPPLCGESKRPGRVQAGREIERFTSTFSHSRRFVCGISICLLHTQRCRNHVGRRR
jgi:hypothetical protein